MARVPQSRRAPQRESVTAVGSAVAWGLAHGTIAALTVRTPNAVVRSTPMAKTKKRGGPPRPPARPTTTTSACLWLVPFYFERPKTNQTGTFQIVIEGTSPDDAMEGCLNRLHTIRETTKLFDEPIRIFSDGLIRLTGTFEDGLLVNFEIPQPGGGRIANLLPDPTDNGAMMFLPAIEPNQVIEPFVEFGTEDENESGPRLI